MIAESPPPIARGSPSPKRKRNLKDAVTSSEFTTARLSMKRKMKSVRLSNFCGFAVVIFLTGMSGLLLRTNYFMRRREFNCPKAYFFTLWVEFQHCDHLNGLERESCIWA